MELKDEADVAIAKRDELGVAHRSHVDIADHHLATVRPIEALSCFEINAQERLLTG